MFNKTVAVVLAFFLGGLGAHHFYLRHWVRGILYLGFCWTGIPAILGLVDALYYLFAGGDLFTSSSAAGSSSSPVETSRPQSSASGFAQPRQSFTIGETVSRAPDEIEQHSQEEGVL